MTRSQLSCYSKHGLVARKTETSNINRSTSWTQDTMGKHRDAGAKKIVEAGSLRKPGKPESRSKIRNTEAILIPGIAQSVSVVRKRKSWHWHLLLQTRTSSFVVIKKVSARECLGAGVARKSNRKMFFLHMSHEALLVQFSVTITPRANYTCVICTLNSMKCTEVTIYLVAENYVVAVRPQALEHPVKRLTSWSMSKKQFKGQHHALKSPENETLLSIQLRITISYDIQFAGYANCE